MGKSQTTMSIQNHIKAAVKYGSMLTSSTAKMFLASGKEIISTEMPAPVEMFDMNRELLSDSIRFLRNPVDAINKQVDRALQTDDFKALHKFANDAFSDLKTGKIYDPDRDRSGMFDFMDGLDTFGGVDMSFNENGDWVDKDSSGGVDNADDISAQVNIAKIQDKRNDERTGATISAIGSSTEAIIQTENANAQMDLRMNMKQHAQHMAGMQSLIQQQGATFELISKGINTQLAVTREAHQQLMTELGDMKSILKTIATNTSPIANKPTYIGGKEQDSVFGTNGGVDIRKYGKKVLKNVNDKFGISNIATIATAGNSIGDLLRQVGDNPWQLVSSLILGNLTDKKYGGSNITLRQQMSKSNQMMQGLLPAILQNFYTRGKKYESRESTDFKDAILGMLGVDYRSSRSIDTAYKNPLEAVSFNHKTARAIEEVIPMYLAKIDAHLSGEPLMVYNYTAGKFERARDIVAKNERDARSLVGRMGDTAREIIGRGDRYEFVHAEDKTKFQNYLSAYLQDVGENNRFVNPYGDEQGFIQYAKYIRGGNDEFAHRLLGILKAMPPERLMMMGSETMTARLGRDRNNAQLNKSLHDSGLIAAFSNIMNQDLQYKISTASTNSASTLSEKDIDNLVSEHKKSIVRSGGVGATNVLLNEIMGTLKRGIITYSYNMGRGSESGARSTMSPEVFGIFSKLQASQRNQNTIDNSISHYNNIATENLSSRRAREEAQYIRSRTSQSDALFNGDAGTDVFTRMQAALNYNDDEISGSTNTVHNQYRNDFKNTAVGKALEGTRESVVGKTGVQSMMKLLRTATTEPFRLFQDGLQLADAFMFKMVFGEDMASGLEKNGEPYLLQVMSRSLTAHFKDAKEVFKKAIADPVRDYLLDPKTGLLPRIGEKIHDILQPGIDKVKGFVKDKFNAGKTKLTGVKDADGRYAGGIMSSVMNAGVDAKSQGKDYMTGAIDRFLYGQYADSHGIHRETYLNTMTGEEETVTMGYGGVIGKLRKGFDNFSEFMFGDQDSKDKFARVKKAFGDSAPNMVIGGGIGLLASMWMPGGPLLGSMLGATAGLVTGSDDLKNFLFGEELGEKPVRDSHGNIIIDPKTGKPKMQKSRKGGVISSGVYDSMTKYLPGVTKGALAGGLAGGLGLLPFGMGNMAGAIIGGMGGMLASSDEVKKLIFGDGVDPESGLISKNFKEKTVNFMKSKAPATLGGLFTGGMLGKALGAGLGLIPGLAALPTGPVMSIMGGLMGFANSNAINKFFFGEEGEETEEIKDKDGKVTGTRKVKRRKGGMFGKMYDFTRDKIMSPFGKKIDEIGNGISNWFKDDVLKPLSNSMEPLKKSVGAIGKSINDALMNVGNSITKALFGVFHIDIGEGGLKEWFTSKVKPKLNETTNKFFSAIGKVIGNVLAAPFKALEFMVSGTIGGKTLEDVKSDREQARDLKKANRSAKYKQKRRAKAEREWNKAKSRAARHGDRAGRYMDDWNEKYGNWGFNPNDNVQSDIAKNVQAFMDDDAKRKVPGYDVGGGEYSYDGNLADGDNYGSSSYTSDSSYYTDNAGRNTTSLKSDLKSAANRSKEARDKKRKNSGSADTNRDEAINRPDKRLPKRTNNSYLAEITRYVRKIHGEIDGQMGNVGWNLEYIKTMMVKERGPLSGDELPETMEGSTRSVSKRRGFFGRMFDRARNGVSAGKDWISDKAQGVMDFLTKPFKLLKAAADGASSALGAFKDGALTLLKDLYNGAKEVLHTVWTGFSDAVAAAGNLIKGAARGFGEAIGDTIHMFTGVVSEAAIGLTSLIGGAVSFIGEHIPDVANFGLKMIKGLGKGAVGAAKGAWNLGKAGIGHLASAVDDHIFHGKLGTATTIKEKITKKKIGTFEISGGNLDAATIRIGDLDNPQPFPWIAMRGTSAMLAPTRAIPVYIAGTAVNAGSNRGMNSNANAEPNAGVNVNTYRDMYNRVDQSAERSNNPNDVYDKAIARAKTQEEIQAITDAQQMNANRSLITSGKPESATKDSSWIGTLFSSLLSGGGGGLLAKIAAAIGGTAIGAKVLSGIAGARAGIATAGNVAGTFADNLMVPAAAMLGTSKYLSNGEYGHAATATTRGGIGVLRGALNIADKFPKSTMATKLGVGVISGVEGAAKGASGKLATWIMGAAKKVLSNGTVMKMLEKGGLKADAILSKLSGKLISVTGKIGAASAAQLLKKANLAIIVATGVYDAASGAYNAAEYFDIAPSDVTGGMRLAAGIAKMLSGVCFGLIPVTWFSQALYKMVVSKETKDELKSKQDRLKAQVSSFNASNGTSLTVDEYQKDYNADGTKKLSFFDKVKNFFTGGSNKDTGFGRGRMRSYSQTSGKWNRGSHDIANAGCGPTAAAIVASRYNRSANPEEANNKSYAAGMRTPDGGTNPAFFKQYAAGKGFGMEQGPTSSGMIQSNLAKGRPIVLMGKGGAYGAGSHYLVASQTDGRGNVSIVDPLTGGTKTSSLGGILPNTTATVYSYGRGAPSPAQTGIVNKMSSVAGKLKYSLGSVQDPDRGVASCASTVAWAYRKALGGDFDRNPMSASSTQLAKDSRFNVVYSNNGSNPIDISKLEPGDIMLYNWNNTADNGSMQHTEMYNGNNADISHGGPGNGPTTKALNENRRKHLMRVLRLKKFSIGDDLSLGVGGSYGSDGSSGTTGLGEGSSLLDKLGTYFGNIGTAFDNKLNSFLDPFGDHSDTSDESSDGSAVQSPTATASIKGNTNAEKTWNFLLSKGLTKPQVAGIMGNLHAESSIDPHNVENFRFNKKASSRKNEDDEYTSAVNSGTHDFVKDGIGYGLAQWTSSGRKAKLMSAAKANNKKIDDLGLQLDYLWDELSNSYTGTLANIKKSDSIYNASDFFLRGFEAPSDQSENVKQLRAGYGQSVMDAFGKGKPVNTIPQATSQNSTLKSSANLSALNAKIRSMNSAIVKANAAGRSESTASTVTNAITDAVKSIGATGNNTDPTLTILTTALGKMIELLSDIKDNTTPNGGNDNAGTQMNSPDMKSVRADNYSANPNTTSRTDVGSKIIDLLTSK